MMTGLCGIELMMMCGVSAPGPREGESFGGGGLSAVGSERHPRNGHFPECD